MSEAMDVIIREAIPSDAEQVLSFLRKVSSQTDYITQSMDMTNVSVEEEEHHLDAIYFSENNTLILALEGEDIIGMATIYGTDETKTKHIGEVGIVIDQSYWGIGLGRLLMEELINWADESSILARLELKVQERNERARSLYQKIGFEEEARMERGIKIDGEFFSVCLMSYLI
ncbi:GNAT family protein [Alkalibacterium iburiense]|uniref:GNAT family protein n=1 Tax=Alkalibacterium iburiense TaxID=290589 RepID=A0ABN0X5X7_9LACT